jgi:hypothetical protein
MPVILATWEAEIRRISWLKGSPGKFTRHYLNKPVIPAKAETLK